MRLTSSGAAAVLVLVPVLVACSGPDGGDLFEADGSDDSDSAATTGANVTGVSSTSAGGSNAGTSTLGGSTGSVTGGAAESTSGGGPGVTSGVGSTGSAGTGGSTGTGGSASAGGAAGTGGSSVNGGAAGSGGAEATSGGSGGSTTDSGSAGSGGSAVCSPADEVCDGLDNDCNDEVDEGACPTGCVGGSFEGHAYLFCDRPALSSDMRPARSWALAMQFCATHGQHLAHVESEEENAFIYQVLSTLDSDGDAWMGATDQHQEGLWSWAARDADEDLTPFYDEDEGALDGAFSDWREGEPNDEGGEDCGIFENRGNDAWVWDDRNCQTQFELLACEDPG